jgi:uncharacterized surface protein with fasciclin (FAS1) repeats
MKSFLNQARLALPQADSFMLSIHLFGSLTHNTHNTTYNMLHNLLSVLAIFAGQTIAGGLRETVASRPDLSIFKDLVDQYTVWSPLESMTTVTVLAPNNAAYELLGSIGLNLSEMGADFTVPVLKYHFLDGVHDSASFSNGHHATLAHTALTGLNETGSAPVKLFQRDSSHLAEGGLQLSAGVVEADIPFDGGVIHTLNSTLVAPHNISATAFMNGLFKFLEIMEGSNMVGDLESIHDGTLFIPTDAAWQRYQNTLSRMTPAEVASVLSYHAIEGSVLYHSDLSGKQEIKSKGGRRLILETDEHGDVRVNGILAVREDLIWYGGVAYVIDEVLTPEPKSKSSMFEPCGSWAKNMASKHPFVSSITGLSAFAIAAILLLIATTQIKRWSSVHRTMSLQLLSKSAQHCEEKGLLADD